MPSDLPTLGDATRPIPVAEIRRSDASAPTAALELVAASPSRRRERLELAIPVLIGVLAFVLRLMVLLHGGGLDGIGAYDDGVYYTAADALLHGRLPYRDFLLIQPPGVVVAALPFAAVGTVAGDAVGFASGRVAFEVLGGVNAALAFFAVRRFGRTAAVVAGVLAAVLLPAVYSERSILLEPLGTFGVLACLVLLSRRQTGAAVVLAGVAAGWAVDVKIWYVVPLAVILLLGTRHRAQLLGGAVAAVAAGYGPFVLPAPAAAVREIVLDQLGRPVTPDLMTRLAAMLDAHPVGSLGVGQVTLLLLVVVAIAAGIAVTVPGAALFPVMLLADAAVLVLAPSWFEHYADLTAPPLALCCGIAVQRLTRSVRSRSARAGLSSLVAVAILLGGVTTDGVRSGTAVPVSFGRAVRAVHGCVTSDDPTLLVVTDALDTDLNDRACAVWPDVTGWTYDAFSEHAADGRPVPRLQNRRWQRAVVAYLLSGRATVLVRPAATGLSAASRARIDRGHLVLRSGHLALRTTTPARKEHRHAPDHHLHPHLR